MIYQSPNKLKLFFLLLISMLTNALATAQPNNGLNTGAATVTCGNLVFTVQEGWKLQPDGESYALMLPPRYNDPQRWVNIAIFKGSTSSGNIDTDFNNSWKKYLGKYSKYQEPYLLKERSVNGYDIVRGGTNIRKGNEMPLYAHLWVAKVKDQLETMIVFANNSSDFDVTVNTEIKPFWAKLKFKNLPGEATGNYTLKGNGIQGIYSGLQSALRMSGGIAKNISFLIIYDDDKVKVTNKLPEKGFANFDREADREMNAGYWGDYDLKKGTVVFNKNNQPRTLGFTYKASKVIYNEYTYTKIPAADGLGLSGTYSADNTTTAVDAFGHEPTMTFYKDGRFEDNTALYYVKSYDTMFKNPGEGRYKINNFTIELLYDDGRGGASFPFVTWDVATNSSIQIGEQILLKK